MTEYGGRGWTLSGDQGPAEVEAGESTAATAVTATAVAPRGNRDATVAAWRTPAPDSGTGPPTDARANGSLPVPGALRRHSLLLMGATLVVGIGNYGFSLAVIWLLSPADFSVVSSLSSLLLVVGNAANAALPWVLARGIGRTDPGSRQRRETVGFTLLASVICGVIAALLVVALSQRYASSGTQAAAAVTAFSIFVAGVIVGYLQGLGRFFALAVLSVLEVVIKLGLGMTLAAITHRPAGAITGAAIGTTVIAAYGLFAIWREVQWPTRALVRAAASQAVGVGSVQIAVSLLVTLDIIVGSLRLGHSSALAGYQAMAMFTRVPLFASIAVSMVIYPRLAGAAARDPEFSRTVGATIKMYLAIAAGSVAIVATLPPSILREILPARYLASVHLLVPLAVAGLAAGLINLTTTFFQAAGRFTAALKILAVGCVAACVVFAFESSSVVHLAWAAAAVFSGVAVALLVLVRCTFPEAHTLRRMLPGLVIIGGFFELLHWVRADLPAWLALGGVVGLVSLQRTRLADQPGQSLPGMIASPPGRELRHSRQRARLRRTLWWSYNATARIVRPLTPPAGWSFLLAMSSLVRSGPAVVVPHGSRVLVIAPHPDDETLGCGGTVAVLAAAGAEVRVVVVTDGEGSLDRGRNAHEIGLLRCAHATEACERLGTRPPTFLGLPDGAVAHCSQRLVKLLAEEVDGFRPDLVFGPWPLDDHPDHRTVAACIARLDLPRTTEIWSYEVWSSLLPNRIVDVSLRWQDKIAALECHQLEPEDESAHLALQRWRSLHGLAGRGYAEAFLVLTPAGHRHLVEERGL